MPIIKNYLNTLRRNLTPFNIVCFLGTLLFPFRKDIGIWVVELSDIGAVCIVAFWFLKNINTSNRKDFRIKDNVNDNFKSVISSFRIFFWWCIITICIAFFIGSISSTATFLMFFRVVKILLYSFTSYIVIFDFLRINSKKTHIFIISGLITGFLLQAPIQAYMVYKSGERVELKNTTWGYRYSGIDMKEFVSKNADGNISALIFVFLLSLSLIKKSFIPILLGIPILVKLYFLNSRSSWIILFLGIFSIFLYYLFQFLKRKSDKAIFKNKKNLVLLSLLCFSVIYFVSSSPIFKENLLRRGMGIGYSEEGRKNEYIGLDSRIDLPLKALKEMRPFSFLIGEGFYSRFYNPHVWTYGAHNTYSQFLWEIGVPGLLLFLNIYRILWQNAKAIKNKLYRFLTSNLIVLTLISGLSGEFFYSAIFFSSQLLLILLLIIIYYNNNTFSAKY